MKNKGSKLTIFIIVAMVIGAVVGQIIFTGLPAIGSAQNPTGELNATYASYFKILTTIFLRLVQMIIAPLVISTLIVGIAKMGNLSAIGRVGGKSMLWFLTASLVSLLLGLVLVNFFEPGKGMNLGNISANAKSVEDLVQKTDSFSINHFIEHLFPKSLFQALAENEILQIVIFSMFFGVALASLGKTGESLVVALDKISKVILKMVGYVMNFAPFGVFGGITAIICTKGLGILVVYGKYLLSFYMGIAVLWIILLLVGWFILKKRLFALINCIKNPMLVAFSTTSSEAVFPKLTEELENFGCKKNIVSFILPLGYSFNLDGSMMYMTFASIFIAQAYSIPLDIGTQLTMLLVLMLTSKGIAGVPRASLVVVAATCTMFKIPAEGIALILPIDHFCDMGRSMTNVLGNALATTAVSKWEGELLPEGVKEEE
jgi:Na+/H+-dicarboxylate symporter